jgi:hypothetical protein
MEPADRNLDALGAQRARDVERARHLVRLHADQHDHAGVGGPDQAGDPPHANARIRPACSTASRMTA